MKPTNLRLQEFRERDEFEIGVNITDDEISEMAEELLELRQDKSKKDRIVQNMVTLSGEMAQENEALIEEMHNLSTALFDSNLSVGELETIRRRHISFMKEINNKTT